MHCHYYSNFIHCMNSYYILPRFAAEIVVAAAIAGGIVVAAANCCRKLRIRQFTTIKYLI